MFQIKSVRRDWRRVRYLGGHGPPWEHMKGDEDVDGTSAEFNNGVVNGGPFIASIKLSRLCTFIEWSRRSRRKLCYTLRGERDRQRQRENLNQVTRVGVLKISDLGLVTAWNVRFTGALPVATLLLVTGRERKRCVYRYASYMFLSHLYSLACVYVFVSGCVFV